MVTSVVSQMCFFFVFLFLLHHAFSLKQCLTLAVMLISVHSVESLGQKASPSLGLETHLHSIRYGENMGGKGRK